MCKKLILKGGLLYKTDGTLSKDCSDIYIEDGIIKKIGKNIKITGDVQIINLNGLVISPGFIDIHTHVFFTGEGICMRPDAVGIETGTTTVFDAGSSGAKNFNEFYDNVISKSKTNVFSLLNIAYAGIGKEKVPLRSINEIDMEAVKETVNKNRKYIKGIKAMASAKIVGELGIKPIELAKKAAASLNIPLVVHIGHFPPKVEDVLSLLEKGDVVTHSFHGKTNGLFDENGYPKKETISARKRGVLFDVGHGCDSFNFNTARKAFSYGFVPDIISTDIYKLNFNGPVYSLAVTITKILNLGIDLEDCLKMVTYNPALCFGLSGIGMIKEGYMADLTIFGVDNGKFEFIDSNGNKLTGSRRISVKYAIKNGNVKKIQ